MISLSRTGPTPAQLASELRAQHQRLVPYAAATALTRCAQHAARTALPEEMRRVFASPVPYTLNSLRIEPASKDKLVARVLVKNQPTGSGIAQEKFMEPEVQGGTRARKRSEQAMGYQGVLSAGNYAMPGHGMALDANGNVKGAEVRTILTALKSIRAASATGKKIRKGGKLKNDLFVGKPRGGSRPDGIWRREGHRIRPLFIFTSQAPQYGARLDFKGVVQRVALDRFKAEFEKAHAAMNARHAAMNARRVKA